MAHSNDHGDRRRVFPVLDAEPPARPRRRLLAAAAVILLAGAVATVLAVRASSHGPRGAASLLHGKILVIGPAGTLVLADPDGSRVIAVRALGAVGQSATVSSDRRLVSLGNGQLATVRPGRVLLPYPSSVPASNTAMAAWPDSFANHDRDLVMLVTRGHVGSSSNPVTVVSLATGRAASLGTGAHAAGDPQAAGAFLSVAAPIRPSAAGTQLTADSRIELRDAGRPDLVLATASALNRDLGQAEHIPVDLLPYPSPSGNSIAVIVAPAYGSDAAGIVVLNRRGQTLGHVPGSQAVQGLPAWSPSGRSLAYVSSSNQLQLRLWHIGGRITTRPLPAAAFNVRWCIWAPDGKSILCAGGATGTQWAIGRTASSTLTSVQGPGFPIAWLP